MIKTADYVDPNQLRLVMSALMPENKLAMEVSLATGLRIGDVLAIRTEQVRCGSRITVKQQKTGKSRRLTIPAALHKRMMQQAGPMYVWSGAWDVNKPRSRQAVQKDMLRARKAYRLREVISPHTARKVWAVEICRKHGIERVQELLGHSHLATTALYALADQLTATKRPPRRGSK